MKSPFLPLLLLPLATVLACSRQGDPPAASPPPQVRTLAIAASFAPATCFATRIGGAHVRVVSPLPKGADAAAWAPSSDDIRTFFNADLAVLNGAGFEQWAGVYTPRDDKTLHLADAVRDRWLTTDGKPGGPPDPHVWLDPALAVRTVEALRDTLVLRDAAHGAEYANNAAALRSELEALDAGFKALPIKSVFAAAPHYAYLARGCGWQCVTVDLAAAAPRPPAPDALTAAAKAHPKTKIILCEEAPPPDAKAQMNALGLTCVVFPTGVRGLDGDYLDMLRENLKKLRAAAK